MRAEQDEASALLDGLDLDTLLAALTRNRGYDAIRQAGAAGATSRRARSISST